MEKVTWRTFHADGVLEGIFPDLFRMQRKNLRPLATMNLTEEQRTHCDDEGR